MPDHSACSGCGLCLLVCPVWRGTRDLRLSPQGRAKALQHGVPAADIAASVHSCTLCGACEPACPEDIGLVDMVLGLRRQLGRPEWLPSAKTGPAEQTHLPRSKTLLIPGEALRVRADLLARVSSLLGKVTVAADDGPDIALALEAGALIPAERLERFLAPLRRARRIVVADGLLLRSLRKWLPRARLKSLGEALSSEAKVRRGLRPGDLYVIEPRAYHHDYRRLVGYYDRLRAESGCALNLDLQRIAIPAEARNVAARMSGHEDDGSQARWLLHGRSIQRIVVESLEDGIKLKQVSDCPVVHVAEAADALG